MWNLHYDKSSEVSSNKIFFKRRGHTETKNTMNKVFTYKLKIDIITAKQNIKKISECIRRHRNHGRETMRKNSKEKQTQKLIFKFYFTWLHRNKLCLTLILLHSDRKTRIWHGRCCKNYI